MLGWLIGMLVGSLMAVSQNFTSVFPLRVDGLSVPGYTALYALIANLVVAVLASFILHALRVERGSDETREVDYIGVAPVPVEEALVA